MNDLLKYAHPNLPRLNICGHYKSIRQKLFVVKRKDWSKDKERTLFVIA